MIKRWDENGNGNGDARCAHGNSMCVPHVVVHIDRLCVVMWWLDAAEKD